MQVVANFRSPWKEIEEMVVGVQQRIIIPVTMLTMLPYHVTVINNANSH